MSNRSKATRTAKRSRNAPDVRLAACLEGIRNIARNAPMGQGTRNRLHAIAAQIEDLYLRSTDTPLPSIKWSGEPPTQGEPSAEPR